MKQASSDKAAGGGKGRKRRRRQEDEMKSRLEQYGVDLPLIPGLPVPIIPLQVHALKTTVACIKKDASQRTFRPKINDSDQSSLSALGNHRNSRHNTSSASSSSLLSGLMDRVRQADATAATNNDSHHQQQQQQDQESIQRAQSQMEARQAWLQAIHRSMRDNRNKTTTSTQQQQQVPIVALRHLSELTLQDRRVHVRRSSLHLTCHLLTKSSDARRWWLEDEGTSTGGGGLAELLNATVLENQKSNNNLSQRLFTRELYLWIQELLQAGHGDLYPRLAVARLRLQQDCPFVLDQEEDDKDKKHAATLQTWRQWRDLALKHHLEEERRVNRLLQRCAACFDILVPRIDGGGAPSSSSSPSTHDNTKSSHIDPKDEARPDLDDDEDDSVDWEDGWEDDGEEKETHEVAVERTLAAIRATAAVENGGIEIDFTSTAPQQQAPSDTTGGSPAMPVVQQRLAKCIDLLQKRHLPRLSHWIEGLTKADQLQMVASTGALLELDDQSKQGQKIAYQKCLELKESLSRTLTSARRLGISSTMQEQEVSRNEQGESTVNNDSNNTNASEKEDDAVDGSVARLHRAPLRGAIGSAYTSQHNNSRRRQVRIRYRPL